MPKTYMDIWGKQHNNAGMSDDLKADDNVPATGFPTDADGKMSKATVNLPKERQNAKYFKTRKP
jgi:hypothetical protein